MNPQAETDIYGLLRWVRYDIWGGRRRYSYDQGATWRATPKAARRAATGEQDDRTARAALECRKVTGGA